GRTAEPRRWEAGGRQDADWRGRQERPQTRPVPESEPLFTPNAGRLVPSAHTRGPWDPQAQHGGPVAALVARAAEAEVGAGFTVTRLTIELQRPVPLEPLTVAARVTKPGRRVVRAEVDVAVAAGGDTVVRA